MDEHDRADHDSAGAESGRYIYIGDPGAPAFQNGWRNHDDDDQLRLYCRIDYA
jgi:hypothetical protein